MKNLRKYMVILALVSVLGVSGAFGQQGNIPPMRQVRIIWTMNSLIAGAYEYLQEMFETDREIVVSDAGIIHTRR